MQGASGQRCMHACMLQVSHTHARGSQRKATQTTDRELRPPPVKVDTGAEGHAASKTANRHRKACVPSAYLPIPPPHTRQCMMLALHALPRTPCGNQHRRCLSAPVPHHGAPPRAEEARTRAASQSDCTYACSDAPPSSRANVAHCACSTHSKTCCNIRAYTRRTCTRRFPRDKNYMATTTCMNSAVHYATSVHT